MVASADAIYEYRRQTRPGKSRRWRWKGFISRLMSTNTHIHTYRDVIEETHTTRVTCLVANTKN